eukprot:1191771-Prorocentrum_minimum.AAC.3
MSRDHRTDPTAAQPRARSAASWGLKMKTLLRLRTTCAHPNWGVVCTLADMLTPCSPPPLGIDGKKPCTRRARRPASAGQSRSAK